MLRERLRLATTRLPIYFLFAAIITAFGLMFALLTITLYEAIPGVSP